MRKDEKKEYYIVNKKILSESVQKVIQVNELIQQTKMLKQEAIKKVGVSRSTYYKYKDYIKPFFESEKNKVFNIHMSIADKPGVLAKILTIIAEEGINILTVVQNIPVDGIGKSTISIQTTDVMLKKFEKMIEKISQLNGVKDLRVVGND